MINQFIPAPHVEAMRDPARGVVAPLRVTASSSGAGRTAITLEESRARLTEILRRLALRRRQFEELERETHASKWRIRSKALKKLVHYPLPWLLPVLCRRLNDRSNVVRRLALTHLHRLLTSQPGPRVIDLPDEALPGLVRSLREMPLSERVLAAELLKHYGGTAVSGAITEALNRELNRRSLTGLTGLILLGALFFVVFPWALFYVPLYPGVWVLGLVTSGLVGSALVFRFWSDETALRRIYLDFLIETLMKINRSHTHRELRDAVPALKRLVRNPADNGVHLSRKGREAIRQIEAATETVRSLPIVHEGDHMPTHELPRAMGEAPSAAAPSPTASRRRRRRKLG